MKVDSSMDQGKPEGTTPSAPRMADADLGRLRIDRERHRERGPSKRRWVAIVVPILVLVSAALVLRLRSGAVSVEETAIALRPAVGGAGGAGRELLTANGYVQARRNAAVSAEVTGRLEQLFVQEGSRVEKGQVVAELASADLRARVARAQTEIGVREAAIEEARAERADAENELSRQRTLLERGLGTAAALDAAQARRDVVAARIVTATEQRAAASAELALTRTELDKTRIRAPFSGTVLRKNAEVGEMVAPVSLGGSGSRGAIVTIADLDSLDVEVDVNEAYIGRLRLGQPARVVTDAYPDTAFAARVRQIVPTSDRQKATVLVKAEILAPDRRLLPDMGAKVTFLADATSEAEVVAPPRPTLPEAAIQREGAETYVWLVREAGTVERRSVQIGPGANGRVEIANGLAGGETVVVRAAKPLRDGQKVRLPEA
jgi:RND family efflux transporter MFP subunit